jgi:flagellar basal-body rod protein FlgB
MMTISLIQLASARLGYLSDTQNMLAGNLANIDTPNFQPAGIVAFSDYLQNSAGQGAMLQNDPNDLPPLSDPSIASQAAGAAQHSPDGNAVSLDQQLVAIAKNDTEQQFAANLYQSYMGMFKTTLGTNG